MKKENSDVKAEDVNYNNFDRGRQKFRNKYVPSNKYKGFWRFSRPEERNHSGQRSQLWGRGRFHSSSQHRDYFHKREESCDRDDKQNNEIKEIRGEIKKLTDILKVMKSTNIRYLEEKVSEDILLYFEEGIQKKKLLSKWIYIIYPTFFFSFFMMF